MVDAIWINDDQFTWCVHHVPSTHATHVQFQHIILTLCYRYRNAIDALFVATLIKLLIDFRGPIFDIKPHGNLIWFFVELR